MGFSFFSHYQSLLQSRAHMFNILAIFFVDISEIKITDENSNRSQNVSKYVTFRVIISGLYTKRNSRQ